MNTSSIYNEWLQQLDHDDPLYRELIDIDGDEEEIRDRFYQNLTFGTAGLRGKLGAGTNRMNRVIVAKATQGIANYILDSPDPMYEKAAVIAHDPRYFSKEFSQLAACIFAANGIKAYLFKGMRPTPQLAYTIRLLKTITGINITASHNPKEYNGYKAYWSDGCQVSSEVADGMTAKIEQVDPFHGIHSISLEEGLETGMIVYLDESYDRLYLDEIEQLAIHQGNELDLSIPIVYTPLNGAGSVPFQTMLKDRGFTNWKVVAEQENEDPDFTTVGYPNPEDPKAFALSESLGKECGAEVLMATDPDADRFAIELLKEDGSYLPLNGNQTGYLLVNYILEGHKNAGTLPNRGAMVKSIVTSTLSSKICDAYHVKMFESLTGFKNICGRIPELEEMGYQYLFGYEESVGYAACKNIRDKDGISAGMLIAEAAAYYRKQGLSLYNVLQNIYQTYGFCHEEEPNIVLEGKEGAERIQRMMASIRDNIPEEISGIPVIKVIDYANGYEDIPPSNVLRFYLKNGSWFAMRPSGTEPKIKFYFYSFAESDMQAKKMNEQIRDYVMNMMKSIE